MERRLPFATFGVTFLDSRNAHSEFRHVCREQQSDSTGITLAYIRMAIKSVRFTFGPECLDSTLQQIRAYRDGKSK
jgi:hypothetical protein